MSELKGAQRLGKAATTLGVSKDTIVEFLGKQGIAVNNDPMAKLDERAVDLIVAEFASDAAAKEKTVAAAKTTRESRTTITLQDTKKQKGDTVKE